MASNYVDFVIGGDQRFARATVERALADRGFRMTWLDDGTGVAERGSKTANLLFGTFAQHFKVGVGLMTGAPGDTVVRIQRQPSGVLRGAIGASRTSQNLSSLCEELHATFSAAGVLHGVREA